MSKNNHVGFESSGGSLLRVGFIALLLGSLTIYCGNEPFAKSVESAHNKKEWLSYHHIGFDFKLHRGQETRLEGRFTLNPVLSRARLDVGDSTVIFDGNEVYSTGPELPGARFHVLTWSYFFAAPYKLQDPGANLVDQGTRSLDRKMYRAARLTFDPGTGDSPDDWYQIYKDPDSKRLGALAYIVTFNASTEEAEKEPHAIVYEDYEMVNGIPIARQWTFYDWTGGDSNDTLEGAPLMQATISNVTFYANGQPLNRNEKSLPGADGEPYRVPEEARLEPLPDS